MRCYICDFSEVTGDSDYADTNSIFAGGEGKKVSVEKWLEVTEGTVSSDEDALYANPKRSKHRKVSLDPVTGKNICTKCLDIVKRTSVYSCEDKVKDIAKKLPNLTLKKKIKPGNGPCFSLAVDSSEFKEIEDRLFNEGVVNKRVSEYKVE
jgi:hypothetical protein